MGIPKGYNAFATRGYSDRIEYLKQDKEKFKCSDVKHLTSIWMFLRILTPFLVVLFGTLDFFKAMAAGDEKKMKESRGKFIKRLIAFFLFIAARGFISTLGARLS